MKRYTIQVTIEEGSDEFWEEVTADGKTGCDELLEAIRQELFNWSAEVKLVNYEDK